MKKHDEEDIQRLKNDIVMLKKLSVNNEKIKSEIRNEYYCKNCHENMAYKIIR